MSRQPVDILTTMHLNTATGTVVANGDELQRGDVVVDTAVLRENTINAGGRVTYRLLTGETCETAVPVPNGTTTLLAGTDGVVPPSNPVTIPNAGNYYWVVIYGGDPNNLGTVGECGEEWFNVPKAVPTIQTVMRQNSATGAVIANGANVPVQTNVVDTTVMTGASSDATGTLTYQFFASADCADGTQVGSDIVRTVTGGVFPDSGTVQAPGLGTYSFVVTYSGDLNNESVTSPCGQEYFESVKRGPTIATVMRRGDNNAGSRAECKVETVFVGKVQPVLTTTMMNDDTNSVIPQNDEVPTGTTVSDTATLVPHSTDIDGNNNLTGTITYTLVE